MQILVSNKRTEQENKSRNEGASSTKRRKSPNREDASSKPDRSRMHRSGFLAHVPSSRGSSVSALRVRGYKETRQLGWRFAVKSVKSDSLVRIVTSPSVRVFFNSLLNPNWFKLAVTQTTGQLTQTHTSSSSSSHTNWVEIRRYKNILKKKRKKK